MQNRGCFFEGIDLYILHKKHSTIDHQLYCTLNPYRVMHFVIPPTIYKNVILDSMHLMTIFMTHRICVNSLYVVQ